MDGAAQAPSAAFVCFHDEAAGLVAADRLRGQLPADVPIIVHTIERDAGLGALLRGRASERLIAVGREDRVFQLAASLKPVRELLAQTVHQAYVSQLRSQGVKGATNKPATHFWEDLDEDSPRGQPGTGRRLSAEARHGWLQGGSCGRCADRGA